MAVKVWWPDSVGSMSTTSQPRLVVAAGLVWLDSGEVLLQRRSAHARHGAGALEFPGGKVERGEAPADALARELIEEWGPQARSLQIGPIAEVLHHRYDPPGPEVLLLVFHVDAAGWGGAWAEQVVLEAGASVHAFAQDALPIEAFLEADRPYAQRIASRQVRSPWEDAS